MTTPPPSITIDFLSAASTYRRKFGGGASQLIAKAVGVKPGFRPSIVDATAGLGRDSFVLANLGCNVQMIERSPVIAAALQEALEKAAHDADMKDIIARMQLVAGDAIAWLNAAKPPFPDVITLDPMFPHREKSALVKKEMRLFRDLVGGDEDAPLLLEAALAKATYRVVVKRPRIAPSLQGIPPSFKLEGASTRFDIYTLRGIPR